MKHPYLAKLALPLLCAGVSISSAYAQGTGTVSGRVLDEKGQGLPGVTVLIEGTSLGGSTDSDGAFSLQNVPAGPHTLIMSFVGFSTKRQSITVTDGQNTGVSPVTMAENTTLLNEAVVVAYGTQRRQDVTGAVEQISEKQFVKGQVTNPEQLIQGKVAGVQVTTGGGQPGSNSAIRIRGGSSLNASNDPLFVIDGVPIDNNRTLAGAANPLSLINPNDIESITVLKDASATAIYGSRASNGVILVTTKRGVQGEKLTVNVSSQNSISEPVKYVDVLSGPELRALVSARGTPSQKASVGLANTDWQREIFRTAYTTDNNVSLTGSVGSVPYRVSGGYLNQEGLLVKNDLKRYTGAVSLTPVLLNGNLRVTANLKGSWIDNNFSDQAAIGGAVQFDPTQPIFSADPSLARYGGYFEFLTPFDAEKPNDPRYVNSLAPRNPVSRIDQSRYRSTVKRSISNLQLDYKLPFLPALSANLNVGYDYQQGQGTSVIDPTSAALNGGRLGQNNQYRQDNHNRLLEAFGKYNATIGTGKFDILGGYSYQDFEYRDYVFNDLLANGELNQLPADLPINGKQYYDPGYNLQSFFGRANYNISDKYLFTATFRADASSRFQKDQRWGYFPAGAFAWRLKGEEFLANSPVISDLKLRLGYGRTGQQDLGSDYYGYQALYTPSRNTADYQLGNQFVTTQRPGAYNPLRTWEKTTTYNLGLDYGFVDGRIYGSVDAYRRNTSDLLLFINLAAGANLSNAYFDNVGKLTNKGVEAVLNVDLVRGEQFNLSVNANGNFNRNEVTELDANSADNPNFRGYETGGIDGGVGNNIQINSVGYTANSFYVYQQVYGTDGKPLDGVVVDRNGDGIINNLDRYRYKSPRPGAILGFGSTMSYNKLNLAFTLRSNVNNYVYNNVRSRAVFVQNSNTFVTNFNREVLNNNFTSGNPQVIQSDYFVENASFLRMENITLGYNFGNIYKERANLRLSFAVQNLFVITKYKGLDPEVVTFQNNLNTVGQTFGIDNTIYPRPRTFTVGLNLGF